MKVLLVTTEIGGGAGKACHRLFLALRDHGVEVRMLYLEGRNPQDPDIVSFYGSVRDLFLRQLVHVAGRRLASAAVGDPRRRYKLPSSIHRLESHPLVQWADVVNLHFVADFLDYGRFFRKVGGKPVVWTMHDMLPFSGGYHCESDLQQRSERVEERIRNRKRRATSASRLTLVAPSDWLLQVSRAQGTFSGKPHRRIRNGIPLEVYKPLDRARAREILNLPTDRKVLLFPAHPLRRKGVHHLLDALRARAGRDDLVIASIGAGRADVDPSYEYHPLGLMVDEVSLALCYSAADFVVNPSVEENSPNTIIESFACGRPVVAFDVGGVGELISDSSLGILVPEIGAEALARGIDRAVSTDFDAGVIRDHAVRNFGFPVLAANYSSLYGEVLAS